MIIKNTMYTPYYLVEDFSHVSSDTQRKRTVKANYIYTRVGDNNTDINKNADVNHVEHLWKKRLGLHLKPFERFKCLLNQKDDWVDGENIHYNSTSPEYTIVFEEDDDRGEPEYYAYVMYNTRTSYAFLNLNYYGTTLYTRQIVYLDGGRFVTAVAEWGYIAKDKYRHEMIPFKYYIKDDISYLVHQYLFNETSHEAVYARNSFMDLVLLFDSEKEKDVFISYIENNLNILNEYLEQVNDYDHIACKEEHVKRIEIERIRNGIALKKLLNRFREDLHLC